LYCLFFLAVFLSVMLYLLYLSFSSS
jgi:hypothetical protein